MKRLLADRVRMAFKQREGAYQAYNRSAGGSLETDALNAADNEVADALAAIRELERERDEAKAEVARLREAEDEAAKHREDMERRQREWAAAIATAGVATEQEMRDADVPWPKSEAELLDYIRSLVERPHDYGTCVYAMSMAACAAFYFVSGKLGVTGFQAGCADMDILRRTRNLKHGFRIVDYRDVLYPQSWEPDNERILEAALRDNPERFAGEAQRLLNERGENAHPSVIKHWRRLATSLAPATEQP